MMLKRFLTIPVCGVFFLMGFVYYVTVFVFMEKWVGLGSSAGTWNARIFTLVASVCLFSFWVCVLTDPGYVPFSHVPDIEGRTLADQQPHKDISQLRNCDKCSTYKPPRAHHCRVCRRCVLRMDHHCLWINNCVGYRNYKAFFLLVFYTTLASLYSMVLIMSCAFQRDWNFSGRLSLKIFYVFSGLMVITLSITLGSLLGWHFYLVTRNMTTIEYREGVRAAWLARKSGQPYRHPYDLSFCKNIKVVFGPRILQWLCPTALSHLTDGLHYPTSPDS